MSADHTAESAAPRKPLLCRLGWHTSTFLDCALMASATRCNKCYAWLDQQEGAEVKRERALWREGKLRSDMTLPEMMRVVLETPRSDGTVA